MVEEFTHNQSILEYIQHTTHNINKIKVVEINKYKRNPSHIEGKQRLDTLFDDFVIRGAKPNMVAEMIMAYGICEIINNSARMEEGLDAISRLL